MKSRLTSIHHLSRRSWLLLTSSAVALSVSALSAGCAKEGCLAGEDGCEVPSPCQELELTCDGAGVELVVISSPDQVPGGLDSMGAVGDFLLRNSRAEVVIDSLDHPSHLAPTGGSILDIATRDEDNDATNHIFQAVGALPEDAVVYTSSKVLEGTDFVAVQFNGHLKGDERQRVYTRYEMRSCDPGVRVRTEMVNGGDQTVVWSNADGTWWGGRSMMPFTPTPGEGFFHPRFGLGTLNDVFRELPWVVGTSHSSPASATATVPCNVETIEGFQSAQVSANGTKRRVVTPRDYEVYERFIGVANGAGAAPGVDLALLLRKRLFAEETVTLSGRIVLDGGDDSALGKQARASVHVFEGAKDDPDEALLPWTEIVPGVDGSFSATVPASRSYVVHVASYGAVQKVITKDVGDANVDLGDIIVPASGAVHIELTIDGAPDYGQVFFAPADDDTKKAVSAQYFKTGPECAPLLGPPFGGSPACNRALVHGSATIDVPPGNYDLVATAGMFSSVELAQVELAAGGDETVRFDLVRLPKPAGVLSADFHVHGAASFDSTIPDLDRVRAFLAADIDVIAATDHDAVWDYAAARAAENVDARMKIITGVETTGQILFSFNSSVYFPQVIGHWIFWPVPFDEEATRRGAPWDELVEPGDLFARAAQRGFPVQTGVIQLNHPWADLEFGRDLGFTRAVGLKIRPTDPLPRVFDGTGPSLVVHTPQGSAFSNADYHAQEVMNGSNNDLLLPYRALWLYLLDNGMVRAGTANSDSHSMTDNVVGTPRNLVFTNTTLADFDVDAFNADVRAGHMIGTNGPIIEATIEQGVDARETHRPGLEPFTPTDDAELHIVVHAPAWVPIEEVRVLLPGQTLVLRGDDVATAPDPLAAEDVVRVDTRLPLIGLLPSGTRDAYIVVEAGAPLPRNGDLDCDGAPDTFDNNGDGEVNFLDVDRNGDGKVDQTDVEAGPDKAEKCADNYGATPDVERPGIGPMPPVPAVPRDEAGYAFWLVTAGGYPYAFTNPFLLDRDGDGAFDGSH